MTGQYTAPNSLSETIQLTCELISRASVTPDDKGCQELMARRLEAIGFTVEKLVFGEVTNFWARRGTEGPVLAMAGHTDVVPTGPESQWKHPPFEPVIEDGMLYGRGAADMKGSLAAFITATERFIQNCPEHKGSIAFLITSDEEGPADNGTVKVIETLEARGEKIDWCLIGEPSSTAKLGDIIKNGRRGSLHGHLKIRGVQGHVAYPHLAQNPMHLAFRPLAALADEIWDQGNDYFPATTFQFTNIHSGTGASNVIPGEIEAQFNLRYCTELTEDDIKSRVHTLLDQHDIDYSIDWHLSGLPFLTEPGPLVDAAVQSIKKVTGRTTELSTTGGTSDGRFIAPTGAQVLELGPLNATIHKVNECVNAADLDDLSTIYEGILNQLLGE